MLGLSNIWKTRCQLGQMRIRCTSRLAKHERHVGGTRSLTLQLATCGEGSSRYYPPEVPWLLVFVEGVVIVAGFCLRLPARSRMLTSV